MKSSGYGTTTAPEIFIVFDAFLRLIGQIKEIFLYSSLFLGCAAAGMAYTSCFIQGLPFSPAIGAVLFMVVFSVYNLNRKTDEAEDAINHANRFSFTRKFEKPLIYAAILAYGSAVLITCVHSPFASVVTMIPLVSGILYSLPILPRACAHRRIKEIPVMKNIVVSLAWGISFSLIPVLMSGEPAGPASIIVFAFIFCWTFIGSVLPDIRDRAGDAATGVKTIPVLIGVRKSRILLTVFCLVSGSVIIAAGAPVLPAAALTVIISSLVYSQGCILLIEQTRDNDLLCDVISDGQFLFIGGIALFFSI
jgi:4-hydroxybenzoate polyprenyltransferase and related prenyltransferases